MILTALTMLVGDRTKFIGIVLGLTFAALLMTQQSGILLGILTLTYGHATDTPQAEVWISDPGMTDFETNDLINERELDNVRAVSGVQWAVPLLRRVVQTRNSDQAITPIMVLGVDDATLIGSPLAEAIVSGSFADALRPDTMIIDHYSATNKLRIPLPNGETRPLGIGDRLIMNGRSIEVVGLCRSSLSLILLPTGYMLRSHLSAIDHGSDRSFNFILAGIDDASASAVCERIHYETGLKARTKREFAHHINDYFLYETGFAANFVITVLLGFLVGAAIAGQTFSQYVNDNKKIFASMKAMGMRSSSLIRMLLIQATFSAMLGFGIGVGMVALFCRLIEGTNLVIRVQPVLLLISFAAVLTISLAASLFTIRSLLRLDPALVFRN